MSDALPDLLRRPADFADGPAADAWFARIADTLLNRTAFRVAGRPHRLVEVEVYYHSPHHPDVFAHRDPVQVHAGRWYFHRTGGEYRGGSFKGMDLTFGAADAHAGVLFRGLETADGTLVDGPSLLVDHVLRLTGHATVAELDGAIKGRLAWDGTQPLVLVQADPVDRPVLRTTRVGLSLRRRRPKPDDPALRFLARRYRYLTEPTRTAKGKPHTVLALYAAGKSPEEIRSATNTALPTVKRYAADFDAGRAAADATPYYGREWTTGDLCRLLGVLNGLGLS